MKIGDTVKVYPHGSPERAAEAEVLLLSVNGLSIALGFNDRPPFSLLIDRCDGVTIIDRRNGAMVMLAQRVMLNGEPWGPWVEIISGGHYEIE